MEIRDFIKKHPQSKFAEVVHKDLAFVLKTIFKNTLNISAEQYAKPPEGISGDIAFACFPFAKQLKQSPQEIAKKIQQEFKPHGLFMAAQAAGPYCNFSVDRQKSAVIILKELVSSKSFGKWKAGRNKKIMIEYSSPNTNKPQHLGHVRNNLLGWSASGILSALGFKVIKSSIVNDRGIHICKSMLAYQKWGNGQTPKSANQKPDHFVGSWYVKFEQELHKERFSFASQKDIDIKRLPDIEKRKFEAAFLLQSPLMKEAHAMLSKWEKGDEAVVALWKKMNSWVYEGFAETYSKLGVDFDVTFYESDMYKKGRDIIDAAVKSGKLIQQKDGAVIVPLKEFNLPDKIALRSDGSSVYLTQDIYLAELKFKKYKLDYSVYCVASEQDLYLQQLFSTLKRIGFSHAERIEHMTYKMVFLPEGKMKSREGKVVDADDIVLEMRTLAREEVLKRFPDLSPAEIEKRAQVIGDGALKYYILSFGRNSDITFDPKASISFEGNTGPYVQYAYARLCSILKKLGASRIQMPKNITTDMSPEWPLLQIISTYPDVVYSSGQRLEPSILANYLHELASSVNTWYHQHSVIKSTGEQQKMRILLIQACQRILAHGLGLLGISTLTEM